MKTRQTSTGKTAIGCVIFVVAFFLLIGACTALFSSDPEAPEPKPSVTVTETETPEPEPTETETVSEEPVDVPEPNTDVYYENCSDVRAAGAAPIRRGDPGWREDLDRDGDGQACAFD